MNSRWIKTAREVPLAVFFKTSSGFLSTAKILRRFPKNNGVLFKKMCGDPSKVCGLIRVGPSYNESVENNTTKYRNL